MSNLEKARNLANHPRATCNEKPKHVKRLDFGSSILDLRTSKSPSCKGIVVDENISKIPSTRKQDFVRQWIETHNENVPNLASDVSSRQFSPILGSSVGKRVERSPVIGNCKKRLKRRANSVVDSVAEKTGHLRTSNANFSNAKQNIISPQSFKSCDKGNEENIMTRKHFAVDVGLETISKSCIATESPILDRRSYSYKRRRRKIHGKKLRRQLSDCSNVPKESVNVLQKKYPEELDERCIDKNMNLNSIALTSNLNDCTCKEEKLSNFTPQKSQGVSRIIPRNICDRKESKNLANISSRSSGLFTSFQSSESETKWDIVDSPMRSEKSSKIEIDSSDENERISYKARLKITSNSSDSDKTVSGIMDNVNAQNIFALIRNREIRNASELVKTRNSNDSVMSTDYKMREVSQSVNTQISQKISQEDILPANSQASEKISQSMTGSKEGTQSKRTDFTISLYSSPPRSNPCPTMMVEALNSAKKRRKPKKGSMVERLQSLINGKASNIRIWRHQMKQATFDDNSIQSVTVRLQKLSFQFGRQFLEGIIIEDRFELLKDYRGRGRFKVMGSISKSSIDEYKGIAIMTIPEIVGKIDMKSETILRIYPPWEILEKQKTVLGITYFNVMSSENYLEIMKNTKVMRLDEEVVEEKYDCPCFAAQRKMSSCKEHEGKPDVVEYIFKS